MGKKIDPEEISAITMSLADYQALSADEQEAKRQEAIGLVRPLIKRYLIDDEDYWILVCGNTRVVRNASKTEDRVTSDEAIAEFEQRMGHPAYSIYRHEVMSQEE